MQDHRARPQHMTTVSLMLVGVRDREKQDGTVAKALATSDLD